LCQPVSAEFQKRIKITEEHNGYVDVLFRVRNASQRVGKCHALSQRALRCTLNHLTVGNRIAERHTELDDVRSSRRQFNQQKLGGYHIGIACRDKRDESAVPSMLQPNKCVAHPTHCGCKSATSWTSLSPRPDRLMMTESPGGNSRATRIAG